MYLFLGFKPCVMTNLPTRLKVALAEELTSGGMMMEGPIHYEPLKRLYVTLLLLIFVVQLVGLGLGSLYDYSSFDLLFLLGIAAAVPILLSFVGFYTSWRLKKSNIRYNAIEWRYEPVQLKIEGVKTLISQYRRKYSRLVAIPYVWYYYLPIFLTILTFTMPLYTFFVDPSLTQLNLPVYILILNLIFGLSFWGGWRSTSTEASKDFTLPLIRESLRLAQTQSKVSGISHIRVVMDKAEHEGYEVYRNPRVVARIQGLENESYLESWTEELGSIDKIMVRILEIDSKPEIVWWWQNRDRWFRKYIGDSESSYYVKNPIPSRVQELGVKDVRLVTENAVAILILEWMKVRDEREDLVSILNELQVSQ